MNGGLPPRSQGTDLGLISPKECYVQGYEVLFFTVMG